MVRGRETEEDEREVERSDGGRGEEVGRMIAAKAVGGGQIRSKLLRHPTWANSLAGDLSNVPWDLDPTIAWRHRLLEIFILSWCSGIRFSFISNVVHII